MVKNLLHSIYLEKSEFQIILDFYKTTFSNQIHPDYHSENHNTISIKNFTGKSCSNSFQTEIAMEFIKSIGIKIAYNYLDVYRIEHGHKHRLPFNSKHHVLSTLSYKPIKENWHFDCNLKYSYA